MKLLTLQLRGKNGVTCSVPNWSVSSIGDVGSSGDSLPVRFMDLLDLPAAKKWSSSMFGKWSVSIYYVTLAEWRNWGNQMKIKLPFPFRARSFFLCCFDWVHERFQNLVRLITWLADDRAEQVSAEQLIDECVPIPCRKPWASTVELGPLPADPTTSGFGSDVEVLQTRLATPSNFFHPHAIE